MYFDPLYFVFLIPPLLLAMWAQFRVKAAYATYTKVRNHRGLTGLAAAQIMLPAEGLTDVGIEGVAGNLTDHYDRAPTLCGYRRVWRKCRASPHWRSRHMRSGTPCKITKDMRRSSCGARWCRQCK